MGLFSRKLGEGSGSLGSRAWGVTGVALGKARVKEQKEQMPIRKQTRRSRQRERYGKASSGAHVGVDGASEASFSKEDVLSVASARSGKGSCQMFP